MLQNYYDPFYSAENNAIIFLYSQVRVKVITHFNWSLFAILLLITMFSKTFTAVITFVPTDKF